MKTYTLRFGSGNPTLVTGLQPTLALFSVANTGATLVGPTITEVNTGWGIYQFQWGTTTPIVFLADGATSSLSSGRYITGQLDPADRADEYGNSLIAQGNSIMGAVGSTNNPIAVLIGSTTSLIGDSSTDPTTLFGYLKRALELSEGQQLFTKGSGSWNMYDRTGATLLRTRTIANSVSTVIRS